ncbi:hypothetical protein BpHYR1_024207 [Brachionus plicatilis]|uniref:Uncharacterized protein n=1 Tax=Brachionus plicatilis TaxID=10195 RepID=A0A3M7SHU1_BRAPC|nr:hypothetical protein BpHYR1_024207 [Brachionus plicatilis]
MKKLNAEAVFRPLSQRPIQNFRLTLISLQFCYDTMNSQYFTLRATIRKERIMHIRSEAPSAQKTEEKERKQTTLDSTRIRNSNYREKGSYRSRGNRYLSCVFRPRATIFLDNVLGIICKKH